MLCVQKRPSSAHWVPVARLHIHPHHVHCPSQLTTRARKPAHSRLQHSQYRPLTTPTALLSSRQQHARRTTSVAPLNYLPSNPDHSGEAGGSDAAGPPQLRVLVVGANPAGLAAAVALAQQAGCVVQVHDSRPDPTNDKHAHNSSTLIGLGKRGLQALDALNLPPPSTSGSSRATFNTRTSGSGTNTSSGNADSSTTSNASSSSVSGFQGLSSGWTDLGPEPLPGLTLLQGLHVAGPRGHRREVYAATASGSQAGTQAVTGDRTAGVAAIDELNLTLRLLAATTFLKPGASIPPSTQPQLVLPTGAALPSTSAPAAATTLPPPAAAASGLLGPTGAPATPLPKGPTSATTAEAAQEAAMPDILPAAATAATAMPHQARGAVEVQYDSRLTLLDAANKQATFMGPGGAATLESYDLIIAADAAGGGNLVTSALQELLARQDAHKHPTSTHHHTGSAAVGGVEQEYRAWRDMPNDSALTAMLGKGAGLQTRSAQGSSSSPQQGWLLVWTNAGAPSNTQVARPNLPSGSAAAAAAAAEGGAAPAAPRAHIPGAPSFTLMAWPSKGGAAWSGCVFTDPQVFEALRSQQEYERFLSSLSAPAGPNGPSTGRMGLPALWVTGIAAQLRRNDRVGKVLCPVAAPPPPLAAPAAGLVALSSAAVPADSPQLLQPGASGGLQEAAALAAHVAEHVTAAAEAPAPPDVAGALQAFADQHSKEATALHKLTAQLSWLRQPFSPSAATAAASVPWGSLAWLGAALGAPHTGLLLQWKCLMGVLPVVAAVQRLLLYKLGLGSPDSLPHKSRAARTPAGPAAASAAASGSSTAAAAAAPKLDASYRKPPAAGQASTSLDSGVHVDTSSSSSSTSSGRSSGQGGSSVLQPASEAVHEAYRLSDVAAGTEPCGSSFLAFLHTSGLSPNQLWRLLQAAPLLVSLLWGGLLWAAVQAVRWGVWAFRAWAWTQSGVA